MFMLCRGIARNSRKNRRGATRVQGSKIFPRDAFEVASWGQVAAARMNFGLLDEGDFVEGYCRQIENIYPIKANPLLSTYGVRQV